MSHRVFSNLVIVAVLLITQLHLLRNVGGFYYFLFAVAFVVSLIYLKVNWVCLSSIEKNALFFLIVLIVYPIIPALFGVVSGVYSDFFELFTGFSRMLFCIPIYLIILTARPDKKTINLLLFLVVLITAVAALSIPYQYYFGSIDWFAESSERSGVARFASLFGSLTALGVVCGYGVMAAAVLFRSAFAFSFFSVSIVVGSILSLQKAAIVNLLLAFLLIPLVMNFRPKHFSAIVASFGGMVMIAWFLFYEKLSIYLSSFRFFSGSGSDVADDVSLIESVFDRLFELPVIAIDYHGESKLLFGIGPKGGSGSFGFPDVPMSHNGIVDLFLVGGGVYFLLFVCFVLMMVGFVYLANKRVGERKYFYFGLFVFLGILLNMPFSGLVFFTPSNAMFFALAIKIILLCKCKKI